MLLRSIVCTIAVVLMSATGAVAQQGAATVVVVVRHAEKAAVEGNDPPLSEAGVRRAERLASIAEEAGVSAVYTTQFRRTRETARPAAGRLNVPVTAAEVTRENAAGYAAAVAKEVLAKHRGKSVLVIGHSNTAPQIVEALSGRRVPPIDDATEFDALYVVVIPESGAPRLVRARY